MSSPLLRSPNFFLKYMNVGFGKAFVKISATCSSLLTYFTSISAFKYKSRIKWYFTSMCLLLLWNSGFLINLTALILSTNKSKLSTLNSHSEKTFFNQTISFAQEAALTYSASVVDKETHCCFWLCQVIAAPACLQTMPVVDFLVSVSPA